MLPASLVVCKVFASVLWMFFFLKATAPTALYTLSLHDALPISLRAGQERAHGARLDLAGVVRIRVGHRTGLGESVSLRSEEHTSELQSHSDLVCRLLLEKKKEDQRIAVVPDTGLSTEAREKGVH